MNRLFLALFIGPAVMLWVFVESFILPISRAEHARVRRITRDDDAELT